MSLPEHWRSTTLGEIADIKQGTTIAVRSLPGGSHPVYGANGVVGWNSEGNIAETTVALGCRGSCGTVTLAPAGAFLANNVMGLRAKPGLVGVHYLALMLEVADLRSSGAISGQVQEQITRKSLAPVRVDTPPVEEQRRIVDVVGAVDGCIDALEAQIAATRTARNGVLADLLGSPGADWKATTLGEVAFVVKDRIDPTATPEQPYLGLEHLVSDERTLSRWDSSSEVKSTTTPFLASDTLFGRLRPYLRKGVLAPFDGVCSTEILVLRTLGDVDQNFLALLVLNERVFHECELLSAGTRMPRTSARDLLKMNMLVPPVSEQRRIVEVVGAMDEQVAALESQAEATRQVRAGVLAELLSGERMLDESYDRLLGL